MLKLHNAACLEVVWDRYMYIEDSLEGKAMPKGGENWQDFLQVYSNKTELFNFLNRQTFLLLGCPKIAITLEAKRA